jgi:hypothetical protein
MWSEKYNYFNVQFDLNFSQKIEKSIVVKYLTDINLFQQINHQTFRNSEDFPWVEILLIETYDGNYSTSEKENEFVTLIAIVTSKEQVNNQEKYIETFKQIALSLNWRLFLEEDDEGNLNIEL